jgi:hypothetical protein
MITTSLYSGLTLATQAMSSKYKTDGDYEELAGSLIVSPHGHSNRRPDQTYPRSPQDPPRAPRAPQVPEGSTPVGAPPRAARRQPELDSPPAARLSRATRSRGGGRSSRQQSAHPERAAVGCGCRRGRGS